MTLAETRRPVRFATLILIALIAVGAARPAAAHEWVPPLRRPSLPAPAGLFVAGVFSVILGSGLAVSDTGSAGRAIGITMAGAGGWTALVSAVSGALYVTGYDRGARVDLPLLDRVEERAAAGKRAAVMITYAGVATIVVGLVTCLYNFESITNNGDRKGIYAGIGIGAIGFAASAGGTAWWAWSDGVVRGVRDARARFGVAPNPLSATF